HLKSTIWTSSPNTPPQKAIRCRTDRIRRTAVELPSLTRRKATRSNSSSAVRNNILQATLPNAQDHNAYMQRRHLRKQTFCPQFPVHDLAQSNLVPWRTDPELGAQRVGTRHC